MQDHAELITVRPAALADAPLIVEFNAALAAESEGKTLDQAVLGRGVELALGDAARCLYFVAESGGRVVGQTMVTFEWSDWRCGWFWWLQSVYVQPEFRRGGVFRRLFEHIRDECHRRSDTCGLRLYVERHNDRAQRTYERLGMKDAGYDLMEIGWPSSEGRC